MLRWSRQIWKLEKGNIRGKTLGKNISMGPRMKLSGVVNFEGLSAGAINVLREFQRTHPEVVITFSPDLSNATASWQSFESMSRLIRVAADAEIQKAS
jgi:hypothetical protein